jgi:hypothetical protein
MNADIGVISQKLMILFNKNEEKHKKINIG